MKKLLALLLLATACGGATSNPATPRAVARASVDLAKDAWVMLANACVDAVQTTGDPSLVDSCGKPLEAAHDLIISAATAVDTNWNTSAACELQNATTLIASALPLVVKTHPEVAPTVTDAVSAASLLTGLACADLGPKDAGGQ